VVQWSDPYLVKGKNIGRANQTFPEEQAKLEFQRAIQKQKDKGYLEDGEEETILPLPMLAHKFTDRGSSVKWPAYVQPKLNGQRMLFDGEKGWSRGGKIILPEVIAHIKEALGELPSGMILDGELMLPGNQLLQESMKAIKKYRPGVSETLQYWVYDIVHTRLPFKERYERLRGLHTPQTEDNPIIVVSTQMVKDQEALYEAHSYFVAWGYEGTMVRSGDNGYDIGHRNVQLQKVKDFVDGEFLIVDVVEGEGRFKGSAIFVCDNGDGEEFSCSPEGEMGYRRELYQNRNSLIGKWLTVRYQELSNKRIPIFPIGVEVRETKDGGY
jgi:DNA ligase-1